MDSLPTISRALVGASASKQGSEIDASRAGPASFAGLARSVAVLVIAMGAPLTASADGAPEPAKEETRASGDRRSTSHLEVGLEVNGFTYVNLSVGYWLGRFGLNLSGGYLSEDSNDIRVDLGYRFYDKGHWRHAAHLMTGDTRGTNPRGEYDHSYVALAYELNYRGVYTQLGFGKSFRDAIGTTEDDVVGVMGAYLGYQYAFR